MFTFSVESAAAKLVQAEREWRCDGSMNEILPIALVFEYAVPS